MKGKVKDLTFGTPRSPYPISEGTKRVLVSPLNFRIHGTSMVRRIVKEVISQPAHARDPLLISLYFWWYQMTILSNVGTTIMLFANVTWMTLLAPSSNLIFVAVSNDNQ